MSVFGIFHKNKRQFGNGFSRRVFVALFLFGIFAASGIVSFILNANAAEAPVRLVEFTSQRTSFANKEPGAWKVTKSAEWVETGKAKITFDVNTIPKYDVGDKLDVLLVVDVSGSMSGQKLEQVRRDASDLVDSLLSDDENRVALVAFESEAEILSGFTSNKTEMLGLIDSLTDLDCTNYYDGLLKAEEILQGYTRQDGRDLVLLFLTDGLPNVAMPNEIAQYRALKANYPYMVINGIQYEMGDTVLQPIIDVSDYQYIADMSSLNNVLFEATKLPYLYDEFKITDYINDDYWTIAGLEAIDATFGEIGLEYDGNTPIVTWDMSGMLRSGATVKLTIEVDLKSEFYDDIDLLMPTNKGEEIESTMDDVPDEDIDSDLTPILKSNYDVIYDANVPSGCTITDGVPETTTHLIFSTVEISDAVLSCPGYTFKGWRIATESAKMINENYFRMPGEDVYIKAIWTNPSISKSMDGQMHVRASATFAPGEEVNIKLKKLSGQANPLYNTTNTKITAFEKAETLSTIVDTANSDNIISSVGSQVPIYAWYDNGTIYYYTDADTIYLNTSAGRMFSELRALAYIDNHMSEWNTSKAQNMSMLFYYTGYNATTWSIGDISGWDVSNVKDMSMMFADAGYNASSWSPGDLSGWDVSAVTNMGGMFYAPGYYATTWSIGDISGWDVSNVTSMSGMFSAAGYSVATWSIGDISGWNTSNVTSMSNLFGHAAYNASSFVFDLSGWDTSKVKNMSEMFYYAGYYATTWSVGDISGWDTSNVTNMEYTFCHAGYKATSWSPGDLSGWDVSKVTSMRSMFAASGADADDWFIGSLSGWDTSKVTNMKDMFYYTGGESQTFTSLDLSGWDVSKVTNMEGMLDASGYNATTWSIGDISDWDTSSVTNMASMFSWAGRSAETWVIDLSGWDTSKVTNMNEMFGGFNYGAAGYRAKTWSIGDISGWDVSKVTDMGYMFSGAGSSATTWTLGDISGWDVSNVTNMKYMFGSDNFGSAGNSASTWYVGDISKWDTSNVTDMEGIFASVGGSNLKTWPLSDLSKWDTSKVTNMKKMFKNAGRWATNFSLNLSGWDTSKVTDMSNMFTYTGSNSDAFSLDLSSWDTSNVTDMSNMFNGAGSYVYTFELNISTWNTSKVTKMTNMFSNVCMITAVVSCDTTIPSTNGAGITNTTTQLFGSTTDIYASPSSRMTFIVAPPPAEP